eukprot:gene22309-biopygen30991
MPQMQITLNSQLWQSSQKGDVNGVISVLGRGANVNSIVRWADSTPLYVAALNGHAECIKALLDRGAEVDTRGHNGYTALHGAALNGYVECIEALLGRGADENIKDSKGQSALDKALQRGRKNVVDALRNHMRRSDAQQDGDQQPVSQRSIRNLQIENRELSTQLAAAKSRNDEHEAQLATSSSRNDECEVHMACMTGQGDVLASQDVETLEHLLANVDKECLGNVIFEKRVERELRQALDAAAECGVCLSAPKDTCLHPCGHTICRSCSDLIQVCPICRQQIAERRRVFIWS